MDLEEFEGLIDDYQLAQESGKYKARVDARIALKDAWRGLEAERDALRKDAERFQWFLDHIDSYRLFKRKKAWFYMPNHSVIGYGQETAREAIDAAIAAKGAQS